AEKIAVSDYLSDDMALLTSHHSKNRRFRRTDTHDIPYTLTSERKWHVLDPTKNTEPSSSLNSRINKFDILEDKLFLQLEPVDVLKEQLASKMWSEDDMSEWKLHS